MQSNVLRRDTTTVNPSDHRKNLFSGEFVGDDDQFRRVTGAIPFCVLDLWHRRGAVIVVASTSRTEVSHPACQARVSSR